MSELIKTPWTPLRKARTVNQTSATFASRIPQANEPANDSLDATGQCSIDMRGGLGHTLNGLFILPYAVATDNQTFSIRVVGYRLFDNGDGNKGTAIWVGPIMLAQALCTADDTLIGLAGRLILNTEMFCDTIALVGTSGNANVSSEFLSPADGVTIASLVVDTKSCERVCLEFSTGSSATSCNALYSGF